MSNWYVAGFNLCGLDIDVVIGATSKKNLAVATARLLGGKDLNEKQAIKVKIRKAAK